jgi:hypothetical protein
LNLTPDVHDPTGKAAPAGMFTISPATLTIQPGTDGQATVTKWYTLLVHSRAAKSVSLKASAQDKDGNSVTETIIDAFLLK